MRESDVVWIVDSGRADYGIKRLVGFCFGKVGLCVCLSSGELISKIARDFWV
jgi:hypothetical protein